MPAAARRPGSGPRSATTRAAPRRSSGWCWPPAASGSRDRRHQVDIDLEQHQVDLADTARRFFEARSPIGAVRAWEDSAAGFAPELWAEMAGLGWLRLGHPEPAGGVGGGALELSVIYQAMGRALTP